MTERQEQRKIKISKLVSIIMAGSILVILISLYQTDRKSEASFTISQPDESQSETTSDLATESDKTQDIIPVYLVGAICKPGIYQIRRGAYLYELIEQAGGMTDEAAVESVNLARSIDSNQLVRIPTRDEVAAGYQEPQWEPGQETNRLVDIGRADQRQLETLPGIGPATARAIITFREKNGPFQTIDDLMRVPGIKEARFEMLKDLICVTECP